MTDIELLLRDKYDGVITDSFADDVERLTAGEPLAYVIGWVPFLELRIFLDSRPLIPRPETEWWTEQLIARLEETRGDAPFSLLDLCAGSGAIGIAILARFPQVRVTFSELDAAHALLIEKNIEANNLDATRATIRTGSLFEPVEKRTFDVIATNPPYIPDTRELGKEVTSYEPVNALFSGIDGLTLIREIATGAKTYIYPEGELWMECDISNIHKAKELLLHDAASTEIHTDPYGRERVVVAHY